MDDHVDQPRPDAKALRELRLLDMPGHLIRRCQQRAVNLFHEDVAAPGPTPRQFAVLLTVLQNEGLIQTDLVNLTGIDRSTVADIVTRLVRRGFIERRENDMDHRVNRLFITEAGIRTLEAATPAIVESQARMLAPIPEGLRAEFLECLRKMAELPPELADDDAAIDAPGTVSGGHATPGA